MGEGIELTVALALRGGWEGPVELTTEVKVKAPLEEG